MKVNVSKMFKMILVCSIVGSLSIPVFADDLKNTKEDFTSVSESENELNENSDEYVNELDVLNNELNEELNAYDELEQIQTASNYSERLNDDVLNSLNDDDFSACYDLLIKYLDENPNCTTEDLDKISVDFYVKRYNTKRKSKGFYDDLLVSATGMNSQELSLSKQYPSDLAAVYSCSQMSLNEASKRYYSGAYLGNQDAFRHTAWNALLVQRFYRLGKGSSSQCMAKTKTWTDAHEYGAATTSGLSSSQFSTDRSMDLLNNAAGRAIGETFYDSSEASILNQVQNYVDNGYCQRIKTDSQMGFSFDQMKAISSWSLRSTNKVGKY